MTHNLDEKNEKNVNFNQNLNEKVNEVHENASISDEIIVEKKWQNIQVGDILRIFKNETIPADLLVLKSSAVNGFCYLETTNLDGESALKVKEAVGITHVNLVNYSNFEASLNVDQPNKEIYNFEGSMNLEAPVNKKVFLTNTNLLLRSGKLKNVDWVDGLVVYTGKDTKIMKNIK